MDKRSDEAALSSNQDQSNDDDVEYIEELDFCSPKFNPALALKSENVPVPYPDIPTFNTLTGYTKAVEDRTSRDRHRKSRDGRKSPTHSSQSHPTSSQGSKPTPSETFQYISKPIDLKQSKECRKTSLPHSTSRSLSASGSGISSSSKHTLPSNTGPRKSSISAERLGKGSSYKSKVSSVSEVSKSEPSTSSCESTKGISRDLKNNDDAVIKTEAVDHIVKQKVDRDKPQKRQEDSHSSRDGMRKERPHTSYDRPKGITNPRMAPKETTYLEESGEGHSKSHSRKGNEQQNIFTRMETVTGPLAFLTRCVKDKEHVRVMTRGPVTVSSICRGYIVAFDKFFNMAMIDVDEIYRRPAALGKVRARASHKRLAAQDTLNKENLECKQRWAHTGKENSKTNTAQGGDALKSKSSNNPIERHLSRSEAAFSKALKPNLRVLDSVYPELAAPMSPYEREALMLGIPDENVERRHVNQLLLRGENIVSISIIEDF